MESSTKLSGSDVGGICERVAGRAKEWREVPLQEKLDLLKELQTKLRSVRERWETLANEVRGTTGDWKNTGNSMSLVLAGQCLNGLIHSYSAIVSGGAPPKPSTRRVVENKVVAQVWPASWMDSLLASGSSMRGELWTDCSPEEPLQEVSPIEGEPGCVGILGPGNVEGMCEPLDVLFLKGKTCVYKSNPVNAKLTDELYPVVFDTLVKRGFIAFVSGGAEAGAAIVASPHIESLFMVGSSATYDRIVWGPPSEQVERKSKGEKLCSKPWTAELGAVTPYIVVPGPGWNDALVIEHANKLAAIKLTNSGHACSCPQLVIVQKGWEHNLLFYGALREAIKTAPQSSNYYPGVGKRLTAWKEMAGCDIVNEEAGEDGAFYFCSNVDLPGGEYAQHNEAFGRGIAFKHLEADDPQAFLKAAVEFCNKHVFGSLSLNIVIAPATLCRLPKGWFDSQVLHALQWGSIGVNQYAGAVVATPALSWGAFARHTAEDIQSGTGRQGNVSLVRKINKSIIYGKFDEGSMTLFKLPTSSTPLLWANMGEFAVSSTIWNMMGIVRRMLF